MYKSAIRVSTTIAVFVVCIVARSGSALAAESEAADVIAAIEAARGDTTIPWRLDVACTDEEASRSFSLFRGEVGVWSGRRQVAISAEDRGAMLDLLLASGFAGFDAQYGGRRAPGVGEAALRITCRVDLEIDGLAKSSIQLYEGEQSAELLSLANRLLDIAAPLAADGIRADSLADGLAKLRDGTLAPETLELRLVSLPPAGSEQDGFILRVDGGFWSRRTYVPGRDIGTPLTLQLTPCLLDATVTALVDANAWSLPVNLRHDAMTELDIGVLGNEKSVIGRSTFRPADEALESVFATLVRQLASQPAACVSAR